MASVSRGAGRLRSVAAVDQQLPAALTSDWALQPGNVLPPLPRDSWSRLDIYSAFQAAVLLSHRALAETKKNGKFTDEKGDKQLEGRAKWLNSMERMAEIEAILEKKKEAEAEEKKKKDERETRKTHACDQHGCSYRVMTALSLAKHKRDAHGIVRAAAVAVVSASVDNGDDDVAPPALPPKPKRSRKSPSSALPNAPPMLALSSSGRARKVPKHFE